MLEVHILQQKYFCNFPLELENILLIAQFKSYPVLSFPDLLSAAVHILEDDRESISYQYIIL